MSTTTPPDRGPCDAAGLFGPGSQTWRIHADPVARVAGLRALLLQALDPVGAAALGAGGPDLWATLDAAQEYLAVTSFGSTLEAVTAASRLRAQLACARGRTGAAIFHGDAHDVLAWGHVCRLDSFLTVHRRRGTALTRVEQDAYVAEQVRAAVLVGLEPDGVPHDGAGLAAALRRQAPCLADGPIPRRLLEQGLTGPRAELTGLAVATLPARARRLYAESDLPDRARPGPAEVTRALHTLGRADR